MDPDSSQFILLAVLLLLTALFTAAETTLSHKRYRFRNSAEEPNPQAKSINRFLKESSGLPNVVTTGGSLAKVIAAVMGTSLVFDIFGAEKGLMYAIPLLAFLIIVLAQILPEVIASKNPERLCFARTLMVVLTILSPVIVLFNLFYALFRKILGVRHPLQDGITEESIIELVAAGQEDGTIHQEEKTMIHGVFDFTDTEAKDVMVPRPDIVAVEKNTTLSELISIIKEEKFSRIPVYEKNIDNILGVVHIKDLILADNRESDFSLANFLRPTIFVPETKKVNDLFKTMKKEKIHLCIVLDEYGGTAGLVTLEDLIEEIMGDIQDEHDSEEPEYHRIDADTVDVRASLRLEELNEKLGISLACPEAETIGGLVFSELGRIPKVGEKLKVSDTELAVLEMEGHRIEKVRLTKLKHDVEMDTGKIECQPGN